MVKLFHYSLGVLLIAVIQAIVMQIKCSVENFQMQKLKSKDAILS